MIQITRQYPEGNGKFFKKTETYYKSKEMKKK